VTCLSVKMLRREADEREGMKIGKHDYVALHCGCKKLNFAYGCGI